MTPAVIKAAALCVRERGSHSQQPQRPDFSNGSVHTLSRELLKKVSPSANLCPSEGEIQVFPHYRFHWCNCQKFSSAYSLQVARVWGANWYRSMLCDYSADGFGGKKYICSIFRCQFVKYKPGQETDVGCLHAMVRHFCPFHGPPAQSGREPKVAHL